MPLTLAASLLVSGGGPAALGQEAAPRQAPAAQLLLGGQGAPQPESSAGSLAPARAFATGFDLGEGQVRALFRPIKRAVLSSEIAGRILELPLREGQRFQEGESLVRFDCGFYEAQLAEARAQHAAAQRTHGNNEQREALNAISRLEVQLSAVEVQRTAALVRQNQVVVTRCAIAAPFGGRVVALYANQFETVSPQTKLLEVIDDSALEVALIVPSRWLRWLKPGQSFRLSIDETGESFAARVERVGARVDPTSQTVDLYGAIEGASGGLTAGMSGTASFEVPNG